MANIKKAKFFHDMVEAEIWGFRNIKRDADALSIASQVREGTGRAETDGQFPLFYGQRVAYTEELKFNWEKDVPEEYRSLQEWWKMIVENKGVAETYMFFIENVSNQIGSQWDEAIENSHQLWKPAKEQSSEKGTNDPKS